MSVVDCSLLAEERKPGIGDLEAPLQIHIGEPRAPCRKLLESRIRDGAAVCEEERRESCMG